jgi:hypothetical protein
MVKTILFIGGNPHLNWFDLFENEKLHGKEVIQIDVASWEEIILTSFSDSGLVLDLLPARFDSQQL